MMGKYIDADKLLQKISDEIDISAGARGCFSDYEAGLDDAYKYIKEQAAADVQEVKHGRWLKSDRSEYYNWECSLCNGLAEFRSDYCPECGAKMEKWTRRRSDEIF